MELTVKKKAFLENLPSVVEDAIGRHGAGLRRIIIEEDAKGCYTVWITYESGKRPF